MMDQKKTMFRRIKVSNSKMPRLFHANPFRIVILEFKFGDMIYYDVCEEVFDNEIKDWFCNEKHLFAKVIPDHEFNEYMVEKGVEENFEFKPDIVYSEWK